MGEDRRACLRLLLDAQNAWAAKFAPSGGVDRALSKRYRLLQGRIQQVISNPELDLDYLSKARALLRVRNSRIIKHVRALYELGSAGALVTSYESIVLSHVHMHVNRILRSTSSGEELVLYHYLVRHLKSMLAREQHSKHAPDREG
jgi:thiopeptide-type bacteriocin biosynthesis protein